MESLRHRDKRVEAQLATAQETPVWGSKASLRDCAGLDQVWTRFGLSASATGLSQHPEVLPSA